MLAVIGENRAQLLSSGRSEPVNDLFIEKQAEDPSPLGDGMNAVPTAIKHGGAESISR